MPKTAVHKRTYPGWMRAAIVVVLAMFALATYIAYTSTGFGYTINRLRCSHKPFIKVVSFEPTQTYISPDDRMYPHYYNLSGNKYYCTEQQAQADGLFKDE